MDIRDIEKKCRNEIPDGLSELEKIRFIYIWLGKKLSLDENYFFGESNEKNKILKEMDLVNDINSLNNSIRGENKVICINTTYIYSYFLNQMGICSYISTPNKVDHHVYTRIFLNDGRILKADLQQDLYNVQFGLKTKTFGTDYDSGDISNFSHKEILEIDKKIGYINDDYRNSEFEYIRNKNIEPGKRFNKEVLKNIFIDLADKFDFSDKGIMEVFNFHKFAFRNIVSLNDFMRLGFESYYYSVNDNKRFGDFILLTDDVEGDSLFVFGEGESKFREISKENLKKQVEKGLIPNNKNCSILGVKAQGKRKKFFGSDFFENCFIR